MIALVAASVAAGAAACSGASTHSADPCDQFGNVRDRLMVTVGLARTMARSAPRVPSGYGNSDRLQLCLLPTGIVKGVFKDGRTATLWEQSPNDSLNSALPT